MSGRWQQRVACPYCDFTSKRSNLGTHLKGARHRAAHGYDLEVVLSGISFLPAIEAPPAELPPQAASRLPAVVEAPEERPPDLDLSSITADEIALGVIESQARGPIPVELIASVVAYVDATRALVGELRSLRS